MLQVKLFNYSGIWISWGEVTSRVIIIIKNYKNIKGRIKKVKIGKFVRFKILKSLKDKWKN